VVASAQRRGIPILGDENGAPLTRSDAAKAEMRVLETLSEPRCRTHRNCNLLRSLQAVCTPRRGAVGSLGSVKSLSTQGLKIGKASVEQAE